MHCYTGKAVIYFYRRPMRWRELVRFIKIYEATTDRGLLQINMN